MYNGFRNFYTTRPMVHVKDLSVCRVGGFGNDIGNALAKYFGFANIAISFGEVFPAIQRKTLDAQGFLPEDHPREGSRVWNHRPENRSRPV